MIINEFKTEDQVRDIAKVVLGFDDNEKDVQQGTGQITTFNQLGFVGVIDRPDGWYLPNSISGVAIILEAKSEKEDLSKQKWNDELIKNVEIAGTKYKNVVGILYNGIETRVYKNGELLENCGGNILQHKDFYKKLFENDGLDKQKIYTLTKRINENLHSNFGVKNLNHRMIFTACALVAKRYGALLVKGMNFPVFRSSILSTLNGSLQDHRNQNQKLDLLIEVYSDVRMNYQENQKAIDDFIECVNEMSDSINSNQWNGEDVMAIFFNEFNRYKGKSDAGQVFTPDHIVSLIYRILGCNQNDVIFDGACGSGTFLVKSMSNMINEAGGPETEKAKKIKAKQLYGIEFDREIFALACANMLLHKDGKTNLRQMDTRTDEACNWIHSVPITKVLMNPPYENKYGCMKIVENVLNNVRPGTQCAFILPDKKLEKTKSFKLLKKHTLLKIVKLPDETFDEGVSTSIFIFEAGIPQGDREIFACEIKEDGLERVKNQRRQDVRNKWKGIEDYWVNVIYKQSGDDSVVWIKPTPTTLSYPTPEKEFEIFEEDFVKVLLDYEMFKRGINVKEFNEKLLQKTLYSSQITSENDGVNILIKGGGKNE